MENEFRGDSAAQHESELQDDRLFSQGRVRQNIKRAWVITTLAIISRFTASHSFLGQ
jgi:hypothetical protein